MDSAERRGNLEEIAQINKQSTLGTAPYLFARDGILNPFIGFGTWLFSVIRRIIR